MLSRGFHFSWLHISKFEKTKTKKKPSIENRKALRHLHPSAGEEVYLMSLGEVADQGDSVPSGFLFMSGSPWPKSGDILVTPAMSQVVCPFREA